MLYTIYAFIVVTINLILCVNGEYYIVPDAEIIAHSPKGLEISIPDEDGIVLFAVHANINKEMRYLEAGQISQDVTRKIDGRWVYKNKHIRLKLGDKLYYWLFVIKDGLGYRRDDITHVVEELVPRGDYKPSSPQPMETPKFVTTTEIPLVVECATEPKSTTTTTTTTQRIETTTSVHLAICEQTLTNATMKLLRLSDDIEELRKENTIMKNIIEMDPDGRKLRLTGNIVNQGDPEYIVQNVLKTKYSLEPKILTAYQAKDNSITFEVKLEDKIDIIKRQVELNNILTSYKIVF